MTQWLFDLKTRNLKSNFISIYFYVIKKNCTKSTAQEQVRTFGPISSMSIWQQGVTKQKKVCFDHHYKRRGLNICHILHTFTYRP